MPHIPFFSPIIGHLLYILLRLCSVMFFPIACLSFYYGAQSVFFFAVTTYGFMLPCHVFLPSFLPFDSPLRSPPLPGIRKRRSFLFFFPSSVTPIFSLYPTTSRRFALRFFLFPELQLSVSLFTATSFMPNVVCARVSLAIRGRPLLFRLARHLEGLFVFCFPTDSLFFPLPWLMILSVAVCVCRLFAYGFLDISRRSCLLFPCPFLRTSSIRLRRVGVLVCGKVLAQPLVLCFPSSEILSPILPFFLRPPGSPFASFFDGLRLLFPSLP